MSNRIVMLLFPFSLAFAAALLVKGYASIGDGFSAGAVAALGAALQYVSLPPARARRRVGAGWILRLVPIALLFALGLLLVPALFGVAPVSHWPGEGESVVKLGSLELHTALLFDAAIAALVYATLVVTFDRLYTPSTVDLP